MSGWASMAVLLAVMQSFVVLRWLTDSEVSISMMLCTDFKWMVAGALATMLASCGDVMPSPSTPVCEAPSAAVIEACEEWHACGSEVDVDWCVAWLGCCGDEMGDRLRYCFTSHHGAACSDDGNDVCAPVGYVVPGGPACMLIGEWW